LLNGRMVLHQFFLTKKNSNPLILDPSDESLIPCYLDTLPEIKEEKDGIAVSGRGLIRGVTIKAEARWAAFFKMIDGKRSTREIIRLTAEQAGMAYEEASGPCIAALKAAKAVDLIVLSLP